MLFFAQIGWAKPVPINLNNFDDWRKGEMQVSLAGPLANLITAFVASIFFALCFKYSFAPHWLIMVLQLIIIYNVNFAIFNLVPIPPLDLFKIIGAAAEEGKSLDELLEIGERFSQNVATL